MIKNYFKVAWRNLLKDRTSSFINIGGLAVGMGVAMLIGLWIWDELSFNKNFKNYDRIAQVIQNVTNNGEVQTWTSVPYPLAEEIRANYGSDFKQVIMAGSWGDHILSIEEKKLTSVGVFFEKGAPAMFSLKMLQGNFNSLDDPSSMLLSASAAKAYFGIENPVNKFVKIDDLPVVKVTGVYEDFPHNSTLAGLNFISTWDFLFKNEEGLRTMEEPWRPNAFSLFVQLNDHAGIISASARIKDAKLRKVNPQLAKKKPSLFLQPMSNWHLYSEFKNGVNVGGAIQYVWMFGIIGIFVLLLACINFMNLSTARSEKRAKEVGIRKTVGSLRSQLIIQLFCESFLTVIFAVVFALLLVKLAIPAFNQIADKQISISWGNPIFWLICFVFMVLTALIAGSYPAFYLSSFKPIKVLKGTFKAGRFAAIPRKILVVLQFVVSVTLITATVIVYQQIQFAKNRPVGYHRKSLVTIPTMTNQIHKHFEAVKDELSRSGAIQSIAESGSPTTDTWNSSSGFSWKGKDPNQSIDFGNISASFDYGKTIGWEMKEGRDFSRDFVTDSSAFILNEAAVHFMGLKNPVGEIVTWFGQPFRVIGVINNMVMESPYNEPRPIIFNLSSKPGNVAIVKLNPGLSSKEALGHIGSVFKKYNPEQPFEFHFVNEEYAKKFNDEERISNLATVFSILTIFISCLGLFGLASFITEQRTREIGVRKVLGASVYNLWTLLSKDFVLLILISLLIATPTAYYLMYNWLQNYPYRSGMSWWVFTASGIGALVITLLTVSYQAIKAALANPVRSLRSE